MFSSNFQVFKFVEVKLVVDGKVPRKLGGALRLDWMLTYCIVEAVQ